MMKHKLSFQQIVTVSICISLAFAFFSTPAAAAPMSALPATVEIGVIYPTTGSLTFWGEEGVPFWEQARADINSLPAAVSQGITFDLIPISSDSTPLGALLAAQDLVANYGVEAIVGLPTSPELSGAIGFLTQNDIAVISSTSTGTAPELIQPDHVYRVMPNELYLARNMADAIVAQNYNRVAIIHRDNGWGTDYANELIARLQANGCLTESVAVPSPTNYAAEVNALANKVGLLGTGNQTAVVMVVAEGEDLMILDQAMSHPTLSVRWFSALAGPEILTGIFGGFSSPGASLFAYTNHLWSQEHHPSQNSLSMTLVANAQLALGRAPRYEHVYLYDAVQLMARAILQAGIYDGPAIAAEIPSAAMSYPPATGVIFFDGNGDRDAGNLAYTCMVPAGGSFAYNYCAFYNGDSISGFFDFLPTPLPPDMLWFR